MDTEKVAMDFKEKLEKFIKEEKTGQISCVVDISNSGIAGYHYTVKTKKVTK